MIPIAIVLVSSALVLYSTAIWTERIIHKLKIWILVVFVAGFFCDLSGTSIMFLTAVNKFALTIHSCSGYSALLIMLLHLIWAILAIKKVGKCEKYFTKFSIIAWMVWMLAFLSGVPRG